MTYKKVCKVVNSILNEDRNDRKLGYDIERLVEKYGENQFNINLLKYINYLTKKLTKDLMGDICTLNFTTSDEKLNNCNLQIVEYDKKLRNFNDVDEFRFIVVKLISQKVDNYKHLILKYLYDNFTLESVSKDKIIKGANLCLNTYNKACSASYRHGNYPYLITDISMIDHFLSQAVNHEVINYKYGELLNQNEIYKLGRGKLLDLHNGWGYNSKLEAEIDITLGFLLSNPSKYINITESEYSETNYSVMGNDVRLEISTNFDINFNLDNKVILLKDDSLIL